MTDNEYLHVVHQGVTVYPGVLAQTVQSCLINVLDGAQLVQSHGEGVDRVVYEGRGSVETALSTLVDVLEAQPVVHHALGDTVHDVLGLSRVFIRNIIFNSLSNSDGITHPC